LKQFLLKFQKRRKKEDRFNKEIIVKEMQICAGLKITPTFESHKFLGCFAEHAENVFKEVQTTIYKLWARRFNMSKNTATTVMLTYALSKLTYASHIIAPVIFAPVTPGQEKQFASGAVRQKYETAFTSVSRYIVNARESTNNLAVENEAGISNLKTAMMKGANRFAAKLLSYPKNANTRNALERVVNPPRPPGAAAIPVRTLRDILSQDQKNTKVVPALYFQAPEDRKINLANANRISFEVPKTPVSFQTLTIQKRIANLKSYLIVVDVLAMWVLEW
jgi:hypothetical protein